MTTEEKLEQLGFDNSLIFETTYTKLFYINECIIKIFFVPKKNKGSIINADKHVFEKIKNFTELLKWNDFYEKQAKRIASRNKSRNGSETQENFYQAH